MESRSPETPKVRRLEVLFALAFALALVAVGAAAAALPPYGNNGRVLTALPGAEARAAGIASYGGGRAIVAGTVSTAGDGDFVLARYRPDGRLDPSFGQGGIVRTDLGAAETATDVKIDSFGQVLVSGYSDPDPSPGKVRDQEAIVARYRPDGSLDPSFGAGGIVRAGRGLALAVVADRADHVLVAGVAVGDAGGSWRVARFDHDGSVDTGFGGGDGEVTGAPTASGASASDLTVDPGGRVVLAVCGEEEETAPVLTAYRLLADGSLDPSFGAGGRVKVRLAETWACAQAISRDQRGRIVVAGNGNRRMVAARLRADGSRDRSFAGDGTVSLFFAGQDVRFGRIAVDGRNRVAMAGGIAPQAPRARYPARMLLAKLRADGRRDRRFAGDGVLAVRFGPDKTFDSRAADATIFQGALYAAGTAAPHRPSSSPARIALFRYP